MSKYDTNNDRTGYEENFLSLGLAMVRMRAIAVNSPWIAPASAQMLPAVNHDQTSNPFRYIPPHYGYQPGLTIVYLPHNEADPAPVQDQYLVTSRHIYDNFTGIDLPATLFRLEPTADMFRHKNADVPVPMLYDQATGQQVVTNRGATLRYFSFLPRYISSDVPGSLLEFWFRLDHRLETNDILMRIERGGSFDPADKGARNTLNMKRSRFREATGIKAWNDSRRWPTKNDLQFIGGFTPAQICLNTTMKVDIANGRLLKPIFSDPACTAHVGYVDSGLPLDYFLGNVETTIPTRRMLATIVLRRRLQELALMKGLPNTPNDWELFNREDEPIWWHDRQDGNRERGNQGRKIDEIDGLDHGEYMEHEFGGPGRLSGTAKRAKTRGMVVQIKRTRNIIDEGIRYELGPYILHQSLQRLDHRCRKS